MTAFERIRLLNRYWSLGYPLPTPGTSYVIHFAGYQFRDIDVALQVMEWKSQEPNRRATSDIAFFERACDAANDDKGE